MSTNVSKKSRSFALPTSLVAKISLGFTVIGIVFLLNISNTLIDANRTSAKLDRMVVESLPIFTHMSELSSASLRLEPLILELIETTTANQLNNISQQLEAELLSIDSRLSKIEATTLTGTLGLAVNEGLKELTAQTNQVKSAIGAITQQQTSIIGIQDQLREEIRLLDEEIDVLNPILDDILYELDDDYVISLMQEFKASTNAGMLIIEKLKTANTNEQIDTQRIAIEKWARDHKTILQALPLNAGEDPDIYIKLIKALNESTDSILLLTQGEYIDNSFQRGLQESKTTQVSLSLSQKDLIESFRATLDSLLTNSKLLVDTGFDDLDTSSNEIQDNLATQRSMSYMTAAVALVLILLISVYLTRYFKKSISNLQYELNQLAHGELAKPKTINGNDEFSQIGKSINLVTDGLRDIVEGIGKANTRINDSVELVSSQSKNTLDFVSGQKEELDMVATALTEMSATANEVASHASDTHEKVTFAGDLSRTGRENVTTSREMIDQVSQQSAEAKSVIDSLNNGVQGIESILTTIGSIAEQTNLLALNAAIEAARAGEQGRGFAVVADEVRALASRTQNSTNEIQDMTVSMLKESSRAVQVMEQSSQLIDKSVESAQLADETIAQFASIMEEVLDLSRLIATASEQQASTVNELSTNVVQVSDLAEQTHHSAEASQMTSAQLRELAEELKQKVSRFKVLP